VDLHLNRIVVLLLIKQL